MLLWLLCVAPLLPVRAQADAPLNYLASYGDKADATVPLTWGVTIISIAVIVIISLLLAGAIWRRPGIAVPASGSRIDVEEKTTGLSWIWIGVGISSLVLLFTVVWTMEVLARITSAPTKPALTVEITAHQWWWQARYLSSDPSQVFTTANEIHIPAGEPVLFKLVSTDVIHSFWIPAVGGKTDVIPGQTNQTWLEAHKPGIYRGQCTEYCGVEHAKMGLLLVAQTPADFAAWRAHQLQSPARPTDGQQWAGLANFNMHCGSCHEVRGTDAAGMLGPDLSHLMQRHTIAAGLLANTPRNLARWISDPQNVKPGALMQKPELSGRELADVQAYLKTLN
ncbi:MAG: cytochrome c oxidase subunit II [Rhizomicrobium sp.]